MMGARCEKIRAPATPPDCLRHHAGYLYREPPIMSQQYFIRRGAQVSGPAQAELLEQYAASGKLRPTDEVATSREGPWRAVQQVPLLARHLPALDPPEDPFADALAAAAARDPLDEAALAAARDACRPVCEDAHVGRTYVNAAGTAVVVLFKVPEEGDDEALWVIGARQEGGVYDGVQIVRFPTWAVEEWDAGDLARARPAPGGGGV